MLVLPLATLAALVTIVLLVLTTNLPKERLIARETTSTDEGCNNTVRSWTFTIAQIADIHLGERPDLDWGPEQDRKTWLALDRILTAEDNIDLIVLSGDQLSWNSQIDDNATTYYHMLGQHLATHDIPWALIFGNHDESDPPPPGTKAYQTTRRKLLQTDKAFPLSLTQGGPEDVFGTSNYWLDIYGPAVGKQDEIVWGRILLLDSGGGMLNTEIAESQVRWVRETAASRNEDGDKNFPIVAFQHIPSIEFDQYQPDTCAGMQGDGGIAPLTSDAGIVEVLSELETQFLAVGHNHGNDYCCPLQDDETLSTSLLHVCFGRHSGYGGYGTWDRGARIFQLTWTYTSNDGLQNDFAFEWKSWVRMESGEVIHPYVPS
jgi:hypothetical protein